MACALKHIKNSAQNCSESFSGVGTTAYVALIEDLETPGVWSEELAGFTPDSFSFKEGKAVIDQTLCTGCGVCAQLCAFDAIN